ncbi:MAG TPA: bifunctional precorrin-2 dehydrogenase/sirohydrochlorin ferrochelatase [Thermomicrobiales bacterium]|nr:bifunctional precorrin-2 dehydrogenase/sirohydrochlorin ferrochelatase [Thermomicrobiales bacterium]
MAVRERASEAPTMAATGGPEPRAGAVVPCLLALDLTGRACVIVGGGAVAERKARTLLAAGAAVRVIAPALMPGLAELARAGQIRLQPRVYQAGDLAGAWLVVAATDRREVNAAVAAAARAGGALVLVADAPDEGDVTMPAVARRGRLTVAVATAGGSPALASILRDRLLATISDGLLALLDRVVQVREAELAAGRRHTLARWRAALEPETLALAERGQIDAAEARLRAALDDEAG